MRAVALGLLGLVLGAASGCGAASSVSAPGTGEPSPGDRPIVAHTSGSCAALLRFRGVAYLGTYLKERPKLGPVLGKGVDDWCPSRDDVTVSVHAVQGIDPAVGVASAAASDDTIYVAEGRCEGPGASGEPVTPDEFLECLKTAERRLASTRAGRPRSGRPGGGGFGRG